NRLPTGFSMPTFTLLGQMVVRLPFITKTSLGHEVLHQWFGNAVEVDYSQGNWAEGLTTDLADQTFAVQEGRGPIFRKNQLIKYESYIHKGNRMPLDKFEGVSGKQELHEADLRAVGYAKCSMVFHMLQQRMGEKKFLAALQDFYFRMRFRTAGWSDLAESFNKVAGTNLDTFFKQWLTRDDIPSLAIDELYVETNKNGQWLVFKLRQNAKKPYSLEVPVVIETMSGTIHQRIAIDAAAKEVRILVTSLVKTLVLDPDYDLMRHLAPTELPPVWSQFEGAPKKLAIMAPDSKARFQPLLDVLAGTGVKIEMKVPDKVTNKDLTGASLLFLGTDTAPARALFAKPELPTGGFTIDVRPHPFKQNGVAVLVASAGPEETAKAAHKLSHYGKYSYLHFEQGRTVEKRTTPSEEGQRYSVLEPPRGEPTSSSMPFEKIIDKLSDDRVVYVGEIHTSLEDHLLQQQVIEALYQQNPNLAIGMEMYSRHDQKILDSYIFGKINEWEFLKKSHWFENWRFDYRLYRGILDFARNNRIPVIGLNIDKEIVNKVFKEGGTFGLSKEEMQKVPPERNLDLPGYQERIFSAFMMHRQETGPAAEKFSGFLQSQALWDETMAATTATYLKDHPEKRMVVIAGREHVAPGHARGDASRKENGSRSRRIQSSQSGRGGRPQGGRFHNGDQ
ncbi:MAG: ChaN family lipoprotein, partial [Deltaproteobacteria bacterium]